MIITRHNHIRSKWAKTKVILRDPRIRAYVPETRKLTASTLRTMLDRYSMVYVKPVSGTYGNGVMRIAKLRGGGYACRRKTRGSRHTTFASLYRTLRRRTGGRPYLVQKGIRLLTVKGRLFDIRVMVQRSPSGTMETTGMIARVAEPRSVVTNYHSGGRPTDVRPLLRRHVKPSRIPHLVKKLSHVGKRAAMALHRGYPGVNMVGADLGLDASLKPWIIELNTSPDPYLFRFLKDKTVHARVLRYARALGRVR